MSKRRGVQPPFLIRVVVEQRQPLTGSAAVPDGQERRFLGWLELMQAIAELLDCRSDARSEDRSS